MDNVESEQRVDELLLETKARRYEYVPDNGEVVIKYTQNFIHIFWTTTEPVSFKSDSFPVRNVLNVSTHKNL